MKKQEPGLAEIINFGFVEKFILNLPCQQEFEKSKSFIHSHGSLNSS